MPLWYPFRTLFVAGAFLSLDDDVEAGNWRREREKRRRSRGAGSVLTLGPPRFGGSLTTVGWAFVVLEGESIKAAMAVVGRGAVGGSRVAARQPGLFTLRCFGHSRAAPGGSASPGQSLQASRPQLSPAYPWQLALGRPLQWVILRLSWRWSWAISGVESHVCECRDLPSHNDGLLCTAYRSRMSLVAVAARGMRNGRTRCLGVAQTPV